MANTQPPRLRYCSICVESFSSVQELIKHQSKCLKTNQPIRGDGRLIGPVSVPHVSTNRILSENRKRSNPQQHNLNSVPSATPMPSGRQVSTEKAVRFPDQISVPKDQGRLKSEKNTQETTNPVCESRLAAADLERVCRNMKKLGIQTLQEEDKLQKDNHHQKMGRARDMLGEEYLRSRITDQIEKTGKEYREEAVAKVDDWNKRNQKSLRSSNPEAAQTPMDRFGWNKRYEKVLMRLSPEFAQTPMDGADWNKHNKYPLISPEFARTPMDDYCQDTPIEGRKTPSKEIPESDLHKREFRSIDKMKMPTLSEYKKADYRAHATGATLEEKPDMTMNNSRRSGVREKLSMKKPVKREPGNEPKKESKEDPTDDFRQLINNLDNVAFTTITYLENQYSIIPENQMEIHLRILNKLCHTNEELLKMGFTLAPYSEETFKFMQKCYSCRRSGIYPNCIIHPGPVQKRFNEQLNKLEVHYLCCTFAKPVGARFQLPGCHILPRHNLESFGKLVENWAFTHAPSPNPEMPKHRVLVIDCEMGGTHFNRSELIMFVVVDYFTAEVLINHLVKPAVEIIDWRTQYSGVNKQWMDSVVAENDCLDGWQAARQRLFEYMDTDTILIGHSLNNDLDQLRIVHNRIIDSYYTVPQLLGRKHGVKGLCADLLQLHVQHDSRVGHDCLEDTLATRELVLWMFKHPEQYLDRRARSDAEKAQREATRRRQLAIVKTDADSENAVTSNLLAMSRENMRGPREAEVSKE